MNCANCGREFTPANSRARYCSAQCKREVFNESRRNKRVLPPRKCLTCGREFTPTHHKRARFCSAACRAAYHNKRMERAATGAADVDMARVEAYLRLPTNERWARRKELNATELKAAERMWNDWHREVV